MKKALTKVLILVGLYFMSWLTTCGMLKLISLCFEWNFNIKKAIGIWLIFCMVKPITYQGKKGDTQ